MSAPSTDHATFVIERRFAAPVERVFDAWSDPARKRRWFACHDDWRVIEYQLDFREGGSETNRVERPDGVVHAFRARYLDIVSGARIVYAYDMHVGGARISVSYFEDTRRTATWLRSTNASRDERRARVESRGQGLRPRGRRGLLRRVGVRWRHRHLRGGASPGS